MERPIKCTSTGNKFKILRKRALCSSGIPCRKTTSVTLVHAMRGRSTEIMRGGEEAGPMAAQGNRSVQLASRPPRLQQGQIVPTNCHQKKRHHVMEGSPFASCRRRPLRAAKQRGFLCIETHNKLPLLGDLYAWFLRLLRSF